MIVTLKGGADPKAARAELARLGLWVDLLEGGGRVQLIVRRSSAPVAASVIAAVEGVELVTERPSAHPLVDRHPAVVRVGRHDVGAGVAPVLMAGPCSAESEDQVRAVADLLAPLGVAFLRGGAFKPRTSPYAFQGHGDRALRWLRRAADACGMSLVTECLSVEHRQVVAEHADLVQIGSRNMHDYALLSAVAACGRPIMLKRGMAATIEEWLLAAEYCLLHGAPAVVFCERGIRSFDPTTRNVLDLGAVAMLAGVHHLPVVADPSHAAGRRDLIPPLARAALAAGAHGVMVEVHPDPGEALSDGPQALGADQLRALVASLGMSS